MDIETHHIKVEKTARFVTYGNLNPGTRYFWIALHGSNMLCEQLLYKFQDFDPEEHFVVAPEALSRFYTNGFSGSVVAAWMTKRDRLEEIDDLSNYLSQLIEFYKDQLPNHCKKIVLAFSQGGTIAYRWLHRRQVDLDYLIPYACWIPEDINLKESATDLNAINTIYTYGAQDQFLKPAVMLKLEEVVHQNELDINMEKYEGDHRVNRDQLRFVFEKWICE